MQSSFVSKFLESAYARRDEIVPLLVGEPGIGKTQGVYDFAKRKGVKVVELYLSQMSPLEISGMTMPNESDQSMQVFDSKRLDSLEDGDVLFLDELLQAPQQVLAACLTLIQERRMLSGRKLPDVFIVAAANPIPDMENRIPASIRQRFIAADVRFDGDAWREWMRGQGFVVIPTDLQVLNKKGCGPLGFNDVTPRTLTKLCRWYSEANDQVVVAESIAGMYDVHVRDVVDDIVKRSGKTELRQLLNAVVETQELIEEGGFVSGAVLNDTLRCAKLELEKDGDVNRNIRKALSRIFKNMKSMPEEFMDAIKDIELGDDLLEEAMSMKKEEEV